jgi:hypothetical protein
MQAIILVIRILAGSASLAKGEVPMHDEVIQKTRIWLEKVIVGLNLCPFAKPVLLKDQIRFALSKAKTTEDLLLDLVKELKLLKKESPSETETTLLIHPFVLIDFLEYNDFLPLADDVLKNFGYEGLFQIASFHPQYQFSGTLKDDIENFTNRSPFPMLHLLREDSVEKAIQSYPDVDKIPERNIRTMRKLTIDQLK